MVTYLDAGSSLHSKKYRPDIDGIRAIAVSSVVVGHAFPDLLPGGFIGVDIFFVISGYLISSILIGDFAKGSFSILNFYNRRIRRIFPALIAVLLFCMLFGWFCLFRPEFATLGRHIAASTLFSENFLLWSESGYFDVSSELKPTLHLWSLAIEEQFYIFWPLLMFVADRRRINFALMFALFAGLSFAVNLHDIATDPTAAYYSPLGRSWELMIGSGLAYIQQKRPALIARHQNAQSFAGLALIVAALVLLTPDSAFPGFWALLPTLGSFLLLSAGDTGWVNRRLLATPPMVWCGLISYPLYLWHWPFLSFAHIISGPITPVKGIACITAAVVAATLSFFIVERPFRVRNGKRSQIILLIGGMVATLGLGGLIALQAVPPRLSHFDAPTRTEWSFLKDKTPDFDNSGIRIYHLGEDRPKQVLFIGDSRVAQYAERLDRVISSDPRHPGVVLAIGGGCVPVENVVTDDIRRARCLPLRHEAYRMAKDKRFDTIVIGGAWNWYFLTDDYAFAAGGRRMALNSADGMQAALDRLEQRFREFRQAGKRVFFLLDNPMSEAFNPASAKVRFSLSATNFDGDERISVDPAQAALRDRLLAWAARVGVPVIDPWGAVCTGRLCRVTTATGQPLYKDRGHFNPDWVAAHADFVDAAVR